MPKCTLCFCHMVEAGTSPWRGRTLGGGSAARDPAPPVEGRVGPVCQSPCRRAGQLPLPFFVLLAEAHAQSRDLERSERKVPEQCLPRLPLLGLGLATGGPRLCKYMALPGHPLSPIAHQPPAPTRPSTLASHSSCQLAMWHSRWGPCPFPPMPLPVLRGRAQPVLSPPKLLAPHWAGVDHNMSWNFKTAHPSFVTVWEAGAGCTVRVTCLSLWPPTGLCSDWQWGCTPSVARGGWTPTCTLRRVCGSPEPSRWWAMDARDVSGNEPFSPAGRSPRSPGAGARGEAGCRHPGLSRGSR